MKPPAASPGRAEKPQLAAPGLARLLLSKSRRGARSRRAPPATSPMFVSRGARTRAANDGEPSSPKVTCIGQVRMRKGKKPATASATAPAVGKAAARDKGAARGGGYYYCRCLKRAFLCGGLFASDARKRRHEPPAERGRRSPWVFSTRDVAVAAAPKPPADPSSGRRAEDEVQLGVGDLGSTGRDGEQEVGIGSEQGGDGDGERDAPLAVSSATTTPPKNALLLMRCRSAPQNRTSPLTSRFPSNTATAPAPARDALAAPASPSPLASPSPSPSPSPRKAPASANEDGVATQQTGAVAPAREPQLVLGGEGEEEEEEEVEVEDDDEFDEYDEDETVRCSSARPLVLQRCKSEPATTAAAKMAAGPATSAGCFWAHGGSGGRRRHAPPPPAAAPAAVALTGH